jgi:hypothetical protein
MPSTPEQLLATWLERQLTAEPWRWLEARLAPGPAASDKDVFITLGLIPRRLGRADLALGEADLAAANEARPGWTPKGWSVDGAARVLTLLRTAARRNDFPELFQRLCRTADVAEAIALYRGLPLYPQAERLEPQAAEGVRSSMGPVFEAVAHNNPYPRDHFGEHRWNHMILKALFVGSALAPVQGLDERANPELAQMLRDYAHERRAAGRPISPELWRCIGPFAEGEALDDLAQTLASADPQERAAAALALCASPAPQARRLLDRVPDLARRIETGALTWRSLEAMA